MNDTLIPEEQRTTDVVASLAVTLDGFVCRADGDVDYLEKYPLEGFDFDAWADRIGALVMGRTTYLQTVTETAQMNLEQTPRALRRAASILVVAACGLAACGGSDGGSSEPDAADTPAADEARDAEEPQVDQAEADVGEAVTDAVADASTALTAEARYAIVAGRLDPEPAVEVEGTNIRLVFPGGSVSEAILACTYVSVISEAGETVTAVYPDGQEVC